MRRITFIDEIKSIIVGVLLMFGVAAAGFHVMPPPEWPEGERVTVDASAGVSAPSVGGGQADAERVFGLADESPGQGGG